MLTGQRAFAGEDIADVLAAVLTREPDWTLLPAGLRPGVAYAPPALPAQRSNAAHSRHRRRLARARRRLRRRSSAGPTVQRTRQAAVEMGPLHGCCGRRRRTPHGLRRVEPLAGVGNSEDHTLPVRAARRPAISDLTAASHRRPPPMAARSSIRRKPDCTAARSATWRRMLIPGTEEYLVRADRVARRPVGWLISPARDS